MKRISGSFHNHFYKMANLPPRKIASSNKTSKQDTSPLQILLQMGFPRHRALKALSATGNRSVQLASDWLLTHVNDTHIDTDEPREYIFYASPTGPLLSQLLEFWEKSKKVAGWNGAHNFPPHITLVSFFKAPDETSLQIAKAVKHVVENVGDPPNCPLKLEPYISHNFMGLFVSEEHADYLKKIAVQYVKLVSSASINLEPHVKSLHITLAYHFDVAAFDALKALVEEMQPLAQASWELRLYSRDPRFAKHQVHKVTQGYEPKASDELELVLGDYVYVEDKEIDSSPDGWVHGTSWLTGVSGYLPAVFTRRTAESDAWTLHRAISLGNNNTGGESRSESDSNTDADGEMTTYPHEDAEMLGHAMSEECFKTWGNYWDKVKVEQRSQGILGDLAGEDWKTYSTYTKGDNECSNGNKVDKEAEEKGRRWVFTLRHGERVDLTYGNWVDFCFDEHDKYTRKDLNLPLTLGKRTGGRFAYAGDSPLTRLGNVQAFLVGEGLRLSGVDVRHVYASAALRCVETAHHMLLGLQAGPEVKIRVEPGLFEFKMWHLAKGIGPFMTPEELHKAGYNVDLDYKPYVNLDLKTPETVQEFYDRNEKVIHSAVIDTRAEGGNIIFVGHASTLDMVARALSRLNDKEEAEKSGKKADKSKEKAEKSKEMAEQSKEKAETGEEGEDDEDKYKVSTHLLRVPYCALAALRGRPWRLVPPPCPPALNSSSGRFDWKILRDPHRPLQPPQPPPQPQPSPYPHPPQHSKTN